MHNLGCSAEFQQLKMEITSPETKKEREGLGRTKSPTFLSLHIA
jgi:hypothetical protein